MASDHVQIAPVVRGAVEVQQQAADRVGGTVAVIVERGEGLVADRAHVLGECGQQVAEEAHRETMGAHRLGQVPERSRAKAFAPFDGVEFPRVGSEPVQARGGRDVALVGDVVGTPGEVIDGQHRPTQATGHEEGSDRKVFVMAGGHCGARKCAEKRCLPNATEPRGGGEG